MNGHLPDLLKCGAIFARVVGILSFVPGFGASVVPIQLRMGLSLMLALLIFPYVDIVVPDFVSTFVTELFLGCFIGITSRILFECISILASLISLQSGLSHAYSFSLTFPEQSSVFYNFLFFITTLGIFDTGVSDIFIRGILSSYSKLPFCAISYSLDFVDLVSKVVSQSFILAFKLAFPFVVTNLTLLVGGGIIARLIPSLPIFLVLTPVQNIVMLSVFAIVLQPICIKLVSALGKAASIW